MERRARRRPRAAAAAAALLAALSLTPIAVTAEQAVYRWVDAAGIVHYTQVAPQGVAYDRVTPGSRGQPFAQGTLANPRARAEPSVAGRPAAPPAAPSTAAPEAAAGSPAALTETQRQLREELEREAQERLGEVRALREENCTQAREQFRQFTTYARIRVTDDDGSVRILTEEQRQQRIAEAQEAIVLNCESGAG